MKAELAAAIRPICLSCYAIFGTLLVAYFIMLAHIVPFLTGVAGVGLNLVPLVLLAMGIASFAGTLIGGQLGDRDPAATIIGGLALMAVFLVLLWLFAFNSWAAIALVFLAWLAAFSIPASLQSRQIREASDAPNFSSTLMNTASQMGIAVGAAPGGPGHRQWLELRRAAACRVCFQRSGSSPHAVPACLRPPPSTRSGGVTDRTGDRIWP